MIRWRSQPLGRWIKVIRNSYSPLVMKTSQFLVILAVSRAISGESF